ncbi:MAG: beta-N-acetylhexosaminidase [Mariprofundales bacterium]
MNLIHHKMIIGLSGTELTDYESCWLQNHPLRGIILFARNIESPQQLRKLITNCHKLSSTDLWVAIDEEGGRIFRIPWQPFSIRTSAESYSEYYNKDVLAACHAVQSEAASIGEQLKALGITHNCAPVLDVRHENGHAIIGNRSYGDNVDMVSKLGIACMQGYLQAGIIPVGKHYPGHGRANADSHHELPHVLITEKILSDEQKPFFAAIDAGLRHIMMAHVRYNNDVLPASLSAPWLERLHKTNADVCVWSDDLCMSAVANTSSKVWQAVLQANNAKSDILLICQPEGVKEVMRNVCS